MHTKIKRKYNFLLYLIDMSIIPLSLYLAGILRLGKNPFIDEKFIIALFPLVFLYIIVFYILDLYNIEKSFKTIAFFVQFFIAFILISVSAALILYLAPVIWYGRGIWAIQIGISFILTYLWRVIFDSFIHTDIKKKNLLILGHNDATVDVVNLIESSRYYQVKGFLDDEKKSSKKIIGKTEDFSKILDEGLIDGIIISNEVKLNDRLKGILVEAKMRGLMVYDIATFYENFTEKIPVYYITDFWIILRTFAGITEKIYSNRLKRVSDLMLAFTGFALTSPVMFLSAIAIKLTSRGPVFYKQVRVGYDDEHFEIIKFRSMTVNAETDGAVWAQENDPRVTLVGKFIRKTRIDELPQLWNILRGDMTLIGPRPERPEFVEQLKKDIPYYSLRHAIKPGLTGWAQVNYRYGASTEDAMEKLQYDLYYIRHLSFRLDLRIFFRTIRVMLFGIGAR